MALADFIQSLQEQDVVYSTPPQPSIRVIPPENQCIKIIPPETLDIDPPAPKVIKLKIKPKITTPTEEQKPVQQPVSQPVQQVQKPILTPVSKPITQNQMQPVTETNQATQQVVREMTQPTTKQNSILQPVSKPEPIIAQKQETIPTYVPHKEPVSQPVKQEPSKPTQLTDDEIFNNTGTEYSKKEIWFSYFEKAKTSRKSNPIVDRMKIGRFTITPDNKVLLLPDYDIVGKDPDDVLKDKWF